MRRVNALPTGPTQNHWYYGPSYMKRIGKASASELCRGKLPNSGWGKVVGKVTDKHGFDLILEVQNISGSYFLASPNVACKDWPAYFGVEIIDQNDDEEPNSNCSTTQGMTP